MIKEKLGCCKKQLSYMITTLIDSLFIFQNNINETDVTKTDLF